MVCTFYIQIIIPNNLSTVESFSEWFILNRKTSPWYILLYNFLLTHPSFIKFCDFSQNLSVIHILRVFFQNSNWFLQFQHLYFLHVFSCKNEYILDNISRISVQKIQKKLLLTFLFTLTFLFYQQISSIDGYYKLINLFHYMWGV